MIERLQEGKANFVARARGTTADLILKFVEKYEEDINHPPLVGEENFLATWERLAEAIRGSQEKES